MHIKYKPENHSDSVCSNLVLAGVVCVILLLSGLSCNSESSYEQLTDQERRSVEYALLGLQTRPGLQTTLFASEDLLVNPTNMDIDARGRIWITEGYNYRPHLNPGNPVREEGDRILILEDTNGNGQADSVKVFYQGNDINSAIGILVLDNRVIVSRSPDVFIFTDTTGNDQADTKEVLFTGIGGEQHDHGVHAFVFGPDGNLYFNTGDAGQQFKNADEKILTDETGNKVMADGNPYRKGMVFRTSLEGNKFEVLGHNFRNIYEVAVDSYGTLWQSDNDDDGNRSVRINYVMEYGNYGYTDEMTGAGWRSRRTNMESIVSERHWYQNDPGVVPNLLSTGAGSPTGILIYEGELLPSVFHGQMIHADAGPNVVRSYRVESLGAGYTAVTHNILEGIRDQWFRPSDVTVAPDGSIFVADWYDPGVGGHQMGDQQRGRIFRIAPEGFEYRLPEFDFSTPEGSIDALQNPNLNARTRAWMKLHSLGREAESYLRELWSSDQPRMRARALWLLSKIEGRGEEYITQALADENPDIRITGLRAVRQLDLDIIPYVKELTNDPSPQVRREVAIALRGNLSAEAAELWVELALQHDEEDRWHLEALGIGAAGQWDRYFEAWLNRVGSEWNTPGGRDIVWRARSEKALPLLAELIEDPGMDAKEKLRYFRAFDFHVDNVRKQKVLISLLDTGDVGQIERNVLTLKHLNRDALNNYPEAQGVLDNTLDSIEGTYDFVDLVEKYQLKNKNKELQHVMLTYPDSSLGVKAARILLDSGEKEQIASMLNEGNRQDRIFTVKALAGVGNSHSVSLLQVVMMDENKDHEVRKEAVKAIGTGWNGENKLVELVKGGIIPASLESTASKVLSSSWRPEIQEVAQKYLDGERSEKSSLLPVSELVSMQGEVKNGQKVFEQSCQICHQVHDSGREFGPALTEIGSKLPKEGLYESILEPSSGISYGYEGFILQLKDGSQSAGIIDSETQTELVLRMPVGITSTYRKSEIISRQKMDSSLMPEELHAAMSQQELVDLVEYLASLKKAM